MKFLRLLALSQFGISGAAVARVWADKVSEWVALGGEDGAGSEMRRFWMFALDPLPRVFGGVSPLAGLLQAACVLVLLRGVEMGKRVTTVMTAIKVIFVVEESRQSAHGRAIFAGVSGSRVGRRRELAATPDDGNERWQSG